jgi:flavin reductase (DIM6/NTAB) family NADH-FMN oxidoreductase RutF
MIIDKEQISQLEKRYRTKLINSLAGFKQVSLIGTTSTNGQSNLAIFNSLIHIGANPPLWGFICRPATLNRNTLYNILETNYYSINYVEAKDYIKAHQTSAKYDDSVSEFEACGFNEHYHSEFNVPFVAEAPVKVLMKFEEKTDITINDTILVIGSIQHIELDEKYISPDGFVALDKLNLLACAGLDAYFKTELINRLSYATPEKWPEKI